MNNANEIFNEMLWVWSCLRHSSGFPRDAIKRLYRANEMRPWQAELRDRSACAWAEIAKLQGESPIVSCCGEIASSHHDLVGKLVYRILEPLEHMLIHLTSGEYSAPVPVDDGILDAALSHDDLPDLMIDAAKELHFRSTDEISTKLDVERAFLLLHSNPMGPSHKAEAPRPATNEAATLEANTVFYGDLVRSVGISSDTFRRYAKANGLETLLPTKGEKAKSLKLTDAIRLLEAVEVCATSQVFKSKAADFRSQLEKKISRRSAEDRKISK